MARPRSAPIGEAERLQKYLAQRGLGSRRVIEEWIRAKRVSVNGSPQSSQYSDSGSAGVPSPSGAGRGAGGSFFQR